MSGILNALLAMATGIVRNFVAWDVLADNTPGNLATATFSLLSNGAVSGLGTPNNLGTNGSPSWYSPNASGIGNNYWVRYTPTAGMSTTNDAGGWTQLNATRSITKSGNSGSASCVFTIEIASDASGINIVFTSTGNVVRFSHT